ncbi:MAG: HNH endonuclease [Planctomycetota bacterium]|nr:MAG: HNH endonuclease [Planctomycetota bacterium]
MRPVAPLIAVTDQGWFEFLARRARQAGGALDEVNFWRPLSDRPIARLEPGTPVFFRLKAPRNAIAGYGFFAAFVSHRIELAWELFGVGNGAPDPVAFLERIGRYRRLDLVGDLDAPRAPLACMVLRDAVFWPPERWLPWGEEQGWQRHIVSGKRERDPVRASRLLAEIQKDALDAPPELAPEPFHPLPADERELVLARARRRVGQGTFRSRLLEAYGRRCAITGEHTEIVLDAAHIQPYLGPRSNHPQNGLLLTKEFHALFDAGYVTVTPELEVRVSPRLKREWDNGHRYYPVDGRRLLIVPGDEAARPSPEVLAWHNERVWRG